MKLQSTLWVTCGALALMATGCLGELETVAPLDNPGTGADAGVEEPETDAGDNDNNVGTAQALFDSNVRPVVNATCSPGGACHSAQAPTFISAALDDSYTAIKAQKDLLFLNYEPTTAKLLLNGAGHQGAQFSAADVAAIEAWLAAEKQQADGGGGDTPSPLAVWSGCMTLADWDLEEVADGWANKNAGNGAGRCEGCHNLGADGFIASDQSLRVFTAVTTNPSFMTSYFTLNAAGTDVVINRSRLESVGSQQAPHGAHGPFLVDGEPYERLVRFYDRTVARQLAGLCDAPRF